MDLQYLRKLLKVVNAAGIDEIEIEEEGSRIRITRRNANASFAPPAVYQTPGIPTPVVTDVSIASEEPQKEKRKEAPEKSDEEKYHVVRSPIVGTFYRAPDPSSDPYVNIGDHVTEGTTLCIVEAMKLMNEIPSDVSGKIVDILVENASPVEYNQPLFYIQPD